MDAEEDADVDVAEDDVDAWEDADVDEDGVGDVDAVEDANVDAAEKNPSRKRNI